MFGNTPIKSGFKSMLNQLKYFFTIFLGINEYPKQKKQG
jgi:hypothetical protein